MGAKFMRLDIFPGLCQKSKPSLKSEQATLLCSRYSLLFIHRPPTVPPPSWAVRGSGPNFYLNKKLASQPNHGRSLLPA